MFTLFADIMPSMLSQRTGSPWYKTISLHRKITGIPKFSARIGHFSRIALIGIFLLLLCLNVPSLYGAEKSAAEGKFDISTAASFNIKKGLEPNIFYFDILGQYLCRFAETAVGVQFTSANTDVLLKALYTPLNRLRHKIGIGTTYHLS